MDPIPSTPPQQRKNPTNASSPKSVSALPREEDNRIVTQQGKVSPGKRDNVEISTATKYSSGSVRAISFMPDE